MSIYQSNRQKPLERGLFHLGLLLHRLSVVSADDGGECDTMLMLIMIHVVDVFLQVDVSLFDMLFHFEFLWYLITESSFAYICVLENDM